MPMSRSVADRYSELLQAKNFIPERIDTVLFEGTNFSTVEMLKISSFRSIKNFITIPPKKNLNLS
jgi:hypothetical protein